MAYPQPLPIASLTPVSAPLQDADFIAIERVSTNVSAENATMAQVSAYILANLQSAGLTYPSGIAFQNSGTIPSSYQFPAPWIPFAFTIDPVTSGGYCVTASTADYTLSIFNYGTQIGTVKFPAGVKTPVITITTAAIGAASWVYLVAPFATDATIAGISVTLAPLRTS